MWWIKFILSILLITTSGFYVLAQEDRRSRDTTLKYDHIDSYSEKNGLTRFMIRMFYEPVAAGASKKARKKSPDQKPYATFEGKTIRNISILTLDPFGSSAADTVTLSSGLVSKVGNRVHLQTKESIIRNRLLVKENQIFDSLLVLESERLVRSMSFVTDVSFFVKTVSARSDSVDIFIRELDRWSIVPGASISGSMAAIRLTDNNFLGLGHHFQHRLMMNRASGDFAYQVKYHIPNISSTYINTTFQYGRDEYGHYIKQLAFNRPFFSPFAKWAAGASIAQHTRNDSIWSGYNVQYTYNAQECWSGVAVRPFMGNSEYQRTTKLVFAGRFAHIRYLEKPPEAIDSLHFFSDEHFYLSSVSLTSRQFVQDSYIFGFGLTEDVPAGSIISITAGYQQRQQYGRIYLGSAYAQGRYHAWGYMRGVVELGTFFHDSQPEQGVLSAGIHYFTNLFEIGEYKFRQFFKTQITIGLNRASYDSLTINDEYGITGFFSPTLSGNSRVLFTAQTQCYPPWDFIGFNFGPFVNFSLGMLPDQYSALSDARVYSQIGFGILIKNASLLMNTFQVSIAYYPIIPGRGKHIVLLNPFSTSDFGFQGFEAGKPAIVNFR
jgi:hypothetical protein